MDTMRSRAEALFGKAVARWAEERGAELPASFAPQVAASDADAHGDYAARGAMQLGKELRQDPSSIARELARECAALDAGGEFERIEAAGGYVNFFLSRGALNAAVDAALTERETFGSSEEGKGRTVIVEYFQLNTAKRPHVGHIRSALIGDALKRIIRSRGYRTISDTHVGDWGTQFGIMIAAYKKFGDRTAIERDPLEELEKLYIRYHEAMEENPALRDEGKREFAKLEQGDRENRRLWEWFNEVSMRKLHEMSALLGLEPFDLHLGESFYEDKLESVADELLAKGIAKRGADGAVTVDLSAWGLDDAVVTKSDGASTYLLRDLAKLKYVWNEYHYERNVYVVDSRQDHHFRQVFKVAELLGWDGVAESVHVSYGFMRLPSGMLSTREGNVIALEEVVREAADRAEKVIEEKNPELKDRKKVARLVGLAALKYFDLAHNPRSDITFVWEEALSFEGNTGPYLEYTHARIHGILRKDEVSVSAPSAPLPASPLEPAELRLMRRLAKFPEAVEDAAREYAPNKLCAYLFDLAQAFNGFYHEVPVLKEGDPARRAFRLTLIRAAAQALGNGLRLLGIEPLEEM